MKQAQRHHIPFVYYPIDHLHTLLPNKLKKKTAKKFEKHTIRGSDRIFVINQGLKDYAVEIDGDVNKITVIPASVDFESFNPQTDGSSIRDKYRIIKMISFILHGMDI